MSNPEPLILSSEFSDLRVEIDPRTGAPVRLFTAGADEGMSLQTDVRIVTGGTEVRAATGGLDYLHTADVTLAGTSEVAVAESVHLETRTVLVRAATTAPDSLGLRWVYTFQLEEPRLALGVAIEATDKDVVVRNLHLVIQVAVPQPENWTLHAPGNQIRPDLPLANLTHPTGISPAGGLRGSTGLIAAQQTHPERTVILWPLSQTEVGDIVLAPTNHGFKVSWQTDVAGALSIGQALRTGSLRLDLLERPYRHILTDVPTWLAAAGITTPTTRPSWAQHANIFEVQIGFSVFGDFRYSPYPETQDLLQDLDRIQDLGYNTLQIMPKQPYPSYNVHDYADITTSYGDEETLREIVAQAHLRGMHVILDILLHGVIDGHIMRKAVEAVRTGPFADRLAEDTPDSFSLDLSAADSYLISWSRHLIDFEPYWMAGSVEHHPLLTQHPEWFCRDSAGDITGIYTEAFDVAHPGWQQYFIDACLSLVQRLDVDGFRFDAPTYNYFHNWSPRTRSNAAVSMLGCLPLFDRLRTALKAIKTEALMYTEPSGVLLRQTMDVNYNYDEQWLITAVMSNGNGDPHWVSNATQLGQWIAERDACLPTGALTAHHIDSHDTFWWPLPGAKWRREQYGTSATAALMTTFALSGGPFMTFVGGENGIEQHIRKVNQLRADQPVFVTGTSDYRSIHVTTEQIYAVLRKAPGQAGLLMVNLSPNSVTADVLIATEHQPTASDMQTRNLAGDGTLQWHSDAKGWRTTLTMAPFHTFASVVTSAPPV